MRNLAESIAYTNKKKASQIRLLESHYSKSIEEIQDFIAGKRSAVGVTSGLGYLSGWYQWNFIQSFIVNNEVDYEQLSKATFFGIESNNVRYFLGKKVATFKTALLFHISVKHLAQALLLGWEDRAIKYGQLILSMLYGKQYNGGHPGYRHAWFILEIFCKWREISLDYDKLNYPPDMGIYGRVLTHWDTKDQVLLEELVDQLTKFHIEQSDEEEHKDWTPDFSSSDYFIYAIEILIWLNIRSKLRLPDYHADNDLMRLSINNWDTRKQEIPTFDLLEQSKAKLLREYSGIEFEI